MGSNNAGNSAINNGILTEYGGNISMFVRDDVSVGTSRIFTLRGGNEIIWASTGDIAALQVLNAGNIQTGGTSTGTPASAAPSVSAPPSTPASESSRTASDLAQASRDQNRGADGGNEMPSLISVEVLGYGGGDAPTENNGDKDKGDDKKKPKKKADAPASAEQLTRKEDTSGKTPVTSA